MEKLKRKSYSVNEKLRIVELSKHSTLTGRQFAKSVGIDDNDEHSDGDTEGSQEGANGWDDDTWRR